jgi:hypothetical protein
VDHPGRSIDGEATAESVRASLEPAKFSQRGRENGGFPNEAIHKCHFKQLRILPFGIDTASRRRRKKFAKQSQL